MASLPFLGGTDSLDGLISYVGEPAFGCLFRFQVVGISVLLHIALVERAAWVQKYVHVVVRVVLEPDTDAGGSVEPEVFPGPPQGFYS